MFESAFMLVPAITGLCYREFDHTASFLICIGICFAVGALLMVHKPKSKTLRSRDGFVIVAMSWILLSLFGALPFMLTKSTDSYIDALFETVSGFTTTGSSIFTDVEILPKCILMWRSFMHWVGGMGILVFIMAFLPLSGGNNLYIMRAESPGPTVSKPVPKIKMAALLLYVVYLVLTLLQIILLLCGGVTVFEALNISFATAGTGGFGMFNTSMSGFVPYVQVVTAVFMFLFSINFGSYFFLLKGNFKKAFTSEVKIFTVIVAVVTLCITLDIYKMSAFSGFTDALRHAFFTVTSIISTTGFATVDFDLWPMFSKTLLVIIMFIGACAGSTGGGIKVSRIIIYIKLALREISTAIHPKQVKKITVDGEVVEKGVVRSIYGYLFIYIGIFVAAMLIISLDGADLVTNFTAVTTTLNNVGPGLSLVGPTGNFALFSPLSKLTLSFCMLAGRLELFPLLLLFVPSTWRK